MMTDWERVRRLFVRRSGWRRTARLVPAIAGLLLSQAPSRAAPPASDAVTVSGNHLLRGGVTWVPHGLVAIAFVSPPATQHGVFTQAYDHFSASEPAAMKAWGADCVRFQVSQPGLDPQDPLHTASFLKAVRDAVLAARAAGLVVFVSIQDESQSGEANPAPLPDEATRRVWQVLAPLFNGDPGIVYEIINEPRPRLSPDAWRAWAAAMNAAIATIRATGSHNVVVADGLAFAERLDGAPALADPLHAIAYAAHPYAHDAEGQTEAAWQRKFGDFALTAPVVVTEWTNVPNYYCDADTPASALRFLKYLRAHGIGLTAYAYDFAGDRFGSVVHGFDGEPSTYGGNLQCGDANFGPGTLVQDWYRSGTMPDTPD